MNVLSSAMDVNDIGENIQQKTDFQIEHFKANFWRFADWVLRPLSGIPQSLLAES